MENLLKQTIMETTNLTNAETKVYLSLTKLGESRVGDIITESELQSSVVHNTLKSLSEKGFVSFILKDNVKHYTVLKPEVIQQFILNKSDEFARIIPQLKELKTKRNEEEKFKVEVFSGRRGMQTISLKIFEDAKEGELHKYFGVSPELLNEDLIEFFKIIETRRKALGLKVKGIVSEKNREQLKTYENSELTFTSLALPPAMSLFKNRIIFFSFEEQFSAIYIESKELAKQYHLLWDRIYEESKKKN